MYVFNFRVQLLDFEHKNIFLESTGGVAWFILTDNPKLFIMSSSAGAALGALGSSAGLPSLKWLKEWYGALPSADSEELVKKFNSSSWVTEIGNFDSKHKSHLQKLHEIALLVLLFVLALILAKLTLLNVTSHTHTFP